MHEDPKLSKQSQITAERGARILASLVGNYPLARENCKAILAVAATDDEDSSESWEASSDMVEVCYLVSFVSVLSRDVHSSMPATNVVLTHQTSNLL